MASSATKIAKISLIIIASIGTLLVLGVIGVMALFFSLGHQHENELQTLKNETATLFYSLDQSKVELTRQDCHDVELQNQCLITLKSSLAPAEERTYITSFLTQNGLEESVDGRRWQSPAGSKIKLVVEYNQGYITTYHQ